jgi:hypothetical protein
MGARVGGIMIHETKAIITITDFREVTIYRCDECGESWSSERGEPCECGMLKRRPSTWTNPPRSSDNMPSEGTLER